MEEEDERTIIDLVESISKKDKVELTPTEPGEEMRLTNLTKIRFGTDRRLDEVSRMLQSTSPPSVKLDERIVKYVSIRQ